MTPKSEPMEAISRSRTQAMAGAVAGAPAVVADRSPDPHPIAGVVHCACCGRFPLVGELVTEHAEAERKRDDRIWACPTCEGDGRTARLGPATGGGRVRSLGGAANVRRAA